jgi:hypothetical protein
VDQPPATTPEVAPQPAAQESEPARAAAGAGAPGFRARGRLRRRTSFLRKARELGYRDLGGLVFNLHRFGQRNDPLVLAKLAALAKVDGELRALEAELEEHQPVTVLHEAGVTACPRCAAIHSAEDHFCPNCGMPLSRHVELPIASTAPASPPPASPPPASPPQASPPQASPQAASPQASLSPPASRPPASAAAPATSTAAPVAAQPLSPPRSTARSPSPPPASQPAQAPARPGEDQPTEILHPPAAGA